MFERDEVLQDLHGRLKAAGINPLDPKVQTICEVVNAFCAEKTREVLEKMQAVLGQDQTDRRVGSIQEGNRHVRRNIGRPVPGIRRRRHRIPASRRQAAAGARLSRAEGAVPGAGRSPWRRLVLERSPYRTSAP